LQAESSSASQIKGVYYTTGAARYLCVFWQVLFPLNPQRNSFTFELLPFIDADEKKIILAGDGIPTASAGGNAGDCERWSGKMAN